MRSVPFFNMSSAGDRGKFLTWGLVVTILAVTATLQPAAAEDDGFHPLDSLLHAMDLKTDVGAAPDFVESSRPKGDTDFLPVGAPHPQSPIKVKTPAELKAAEASLDAARMQHDRISGRKPPDAKAAGKAADKTAGKAAGKAAPIASANGNVKN